MVGVLLNELGRSLIEIISDNGLFSIHQLCKIRVVRRCIESVLSSATSMCVSMSVCVCVPLIRPILVRTLIAFVAHAINVLLPHFW